MEKLCLMLPSKNGEPGWHQIQSQHLAVPHTVGFPSDMACHQGMWMITGADVLAEIHQIILEKTAYAVLRQLLQSQTGFPSLPRLHWRCHQSLSDTIASPPGRHGRWKHFQQHVWQEMMSAVTRDCLRLPVIVFFDATGVTPAP